MKAYEWRAQFKSSGTARQLPDIQSVNIFRGRQRQIDDYAADRLTIADIVAFASIDFARMIKFKPPEEMTHVNRWLEAMKSRESVKIAL